MRLSDLAPEDVVGDVPRIILTGREKVLIERHNGLFSYESGCIRLRTRMGLLTVTGEQLIISHFGTEDVLIRGQVDGLRVDGENT